MAKNGPEKLPKWSKIKKNSAELEVDFFQTWDQLKGSVLKVLPGSGCRGKFRKSSDLFKRLLKRLKIVDDLQQEKLR